MHSPDLVVPPGHDQYPIQSLLATLDNTVREATNSGNTGDVESGRGYMDWQLKNLFELGHPHAQRVSEIIENSSSLQEASRQLFSLACLIEKEIHEMQVRKENTLQFRDTASKTSTSQESESPMSLAA